MSPSARGVGPIILTDLNTPWERVLHLGVPVTFRPKQMISFDNGDASGFFYVRKGRVRLSYISVCGQEKVLFYVGRGTFFHDIPALIASECIFTCMEATSAVYFSKRLITLSFAREHPDLILNWVESTAKKSNNFFNQICGAGLFDSFANVCRALYSMALHNREGDRVVPHLTHQELASLLGIHRGSLHKALSRLKREGIINEYSRHRLEILDLEKLAARAMRSDFEQTRPPR